MGFLFNYNKEGRGVTREEVLSESPLKRFGVELVHRFWQLIVLNLLYILACVPIITIGPATAAMNYVCRNFSQAKPVDFFSDFIEKCKEHFKQGVIVFLLQAVMGAALYFSFNMWTNPELWGGEEAFASMEGMRTVAVVFIFLVGYLLVFGSFYVYPMMVSFDLPLKQLLRNTAILAVSQLWRNILMILTVLALAFLTYLFWPISFPIPLFLAFSLSCYVSNSLVFPVLKRYVAAPEEPKEPEPEFFGGDEELPEEPEEKTEE